MEKLNYLADLHTHTVASGHAYNTINEMVNAAKAKHLSILGITEHSMTMPGTCHEFYFNNLRNAKRDYGDGLELLLGVELNIIDYDGNVDMSDELIKQMDVVIASIHADIGYTPGTIEENTKSIIGAIKNPLIGIIGHPDDGRIPLDYEQVVKAAKEYGTLLEINNNSLNPSGFRKNTRENDKTILELCKKYQVPVVIGSDAHSEDIVGLNERAYDVMDEVDFDNELVMNFHIAKLRKYLGKYKRSK